METSTAKTGYIAAKTNKTVSRTTFVVTIVIEILGANVMAPLIVLTTAHVLYSVTDGLMYTVVTMMAMQILVRMIINILELLLIQIIVSITLITWTEIAI